MTPKQQEVEQLAIALMKKWGLFCRDSGWGFRFNRRKRILGLCFYPVPHLEEPGRIELSGWYAACGDMADIRDTILHEIAHALAGELAGHGPAWVEWCRKVGAKPQPCTHIVLPPGSWQATCPSCGYLHSLYRRPKRLHSWCCRTCGPTLGPLSWNKCG